MDTQASKKFKVQISHVRNYLFLHLAGRGEVGGADIGTRELNVWQETREG